MTIYTYTLDLPYTNPELNRREFYRLPRSILLPPYLAVNPYFVEYTNAIDTVFDYNVEAKTDALRNIRNMWVTTKELESKIQNQEMIEFVEWGGVDRTTLIQQVNMLGLKLANAGVFSEDGFRALSKFLGTFWFEKGKSTAIDFINFCLGVEFKIYRLWTADYVDFLKEGDSGIGATIYDTPAGDWYPTTHVVVEAPAGYDVDPQALTNFFYEICNYNLVLYGFQQGLELPILSIDSEVNASVVNLALDDMDSVGIASTPPTFGLDLNTYAVAGLDIGYFTS